MKGTQSKSKKPRRVYASTQKPLAGRENRNIKDERAPWVLFFRDSQNIYINELAKRARRSPTHGAIIRSKVTYTCGKGFVWMNENGEPTEPSSKTKEWAKLVNNKGQDLQDVFRQTALYYIMTGNAYIQGVKVDKRLNIFGADSTKVRVSKDLETGYISSFWRDIKTNPNPNQRDFPVSKIDLWQQKEQNKWLYHIKQDEPEYDYYGLPEHHHVLKWADIEYQIPTFNLSRFKNGFFPSVLMQILGEPPQGISEQEYVEKIRDAFTGEDNTHKMFVEMVDSPELSANVETFDGVKDGEFTTLDQLASTRIISGHRWFASLAGIQTAGELGSNQRIRNEYFIALNSVVIPEYQEPLLRVFNEVILPEAGITEKIGIHNVPPVGVSDQLDARLVLNRNEQRQELGYEPLEDEAIGEEFPEVTRRRSNDG